MAPIRRSQTLKRGGRRANLLPVVTKKRKPVSTETTNSQRAPRKIKAEPEKDSLTPTVKSVKSTEIKNQQTDPTSKKISSTGTKPLVSKSTRSRLNRDHEVTVKSEIVELSNLENRPTSASSSSSEETDTDNEPLQHRMQRVRFQFGQNKRVPDLSGGQNGDLNSTPVKGHCSASSGGEKDLSAWKGSPISTWRKLREPEITEMIKIVQSKPQLWLQNHPNFRDYRARLSVFCEIAQQLNVDMKTVRNTWNSLKGQFFNHRNAMVYNKTAWARKKAMHRATEWPYYKPLMFLSEHDTEKPFKTNHPRSASIKSPPFNPARGIKTSGTRATNSPVPFRFGQTVTSPGDNFRKSAESSISTPENSGFSPPSIVHTPPNFRFGSPPVNKVKAPPSSTYTPTAAAAGPSGAGVGHDYHTFAKPFQKWDPNQKYIQDKSPEDDTNRPKSPNDSQDTGTGKSNKSKTFTVIANMWKLIPEDQLAPCYTECMQVLLKYTSLD